jgi:hypothetical protein
MSNVFISNNMSTTLYEDSFCDEQIFGIFHESETGILARELCGKNALFNAIFDKSNGYIILKFISMSMLYVRCLLSCFFY